MSTKDKLVDKILESQKILTEIQARNYLTNLFDFNTKVLEVEKNGQKLAKAHKEMCTFIDDEPKKAKLLLYPRGHLKSTLVTVGHSLRRICENPGVRILIANATYSLACSFLDQIKSNLKDNQNLHKYYGDLAKSSAKWSENQIKVGKGNYDKKEPTVTAMGITGSLTSQHYDVVIIDDAVNRENITTIEQIQKVYKFYMDVLDLLEPGGELIIIGTRWHDIDLYGWIMGGDNYREGEIPKKILQDIMPHQFVYHGNNFNIMKRKVVEGGTAIWPEKFTAEHIAKLKKEKTPYEFCTPAETPILMADFTTKPISEIKIGDKVIGFTRGTPKNRGSLVITKVKNISKTMGKVCDFKMESGRKVRCTKNHRWYTKRNSKTHKTYKPARVGSRLMFVMEPQKEISIKEKLLWNYLAGFFDGDGSALGGAKLLLTQSKKHNPDVYKKILDVIKKLKIPYGEYIREKSNNMIWLNDSFNTSIKLLRYADFGKKKQVYDRLISHSKRFVKEKDKVLWIKESQTPEEVYGLETGTGNYIAWGYASSNSTQYNNEPIPEEDQQFKKEWFRYYIEDDIKKRNLNFFTMVDPAISQEAGADYTVITTIAVDEYWNWFIWEVIREHFLPNEIIGEMFKTYERHHPMEMGLEVVAYQKMLGYALRDEMRTRKKYLPIRELKPPKNKSKEVRIKSLQPGYFNGKIFHKERMLNLEYLEDELLRFPRGSHDDIIDTLAYLTEFAIPPKSERKKSVKQTYLY